MAALRQTRASVRRGARAGRVVGSGESADRRVFGRDAPTTGCQALVDRPRLLVLDEPVSSLDPEGRRDVLALIAELRETATVIFSTHVLTDIERICDRVGILDHGRLVTEAPLDEVARPLRAAPLPAGAQIEEDAGLARLATALRSISWVDRVDVDGVGMTVGVTDEDAASRELLRAVVAAEVRLAAFERVRPDLEDVFLRLVGRGSAESAA